MSADWFEKGLRERLPTELRDSFSQEQLSALKIAFGARKWGSHKVDVRTTFKFWQYRYYFILLLGRNRREMSRREKQTAQLIQAAFIAGFLLFSTLLGILVLYLIKSALGIDIFPGYSFGVWSWFKTEFLH